MKINIVTVSNESYSKFLRVWLSSFYDVMDLSNINKVYIANTGFSKETRNFISCFPKTEIVETGIKSSFSKLHDEEWGKSNYCKLPIIKNVLSKDKIPTFFIDVDCLFNYDFYESLDLSNDLFVCDTSDRTAHCNSKYIGSFYGFGVENIQKNIAFIDKWHDTILNSTKIVQAWRESPSLSMLVMDQNYAKSYKIQYLNESKISANLFSPKNDPFIYHLKSEGAFGYITEEQRLNMPHVSRKIKRYVVDYV